MEPAEERGPGETTRPRREQLDTLSAVLEAVRLTGAVFFLVDGAAPWVAEAPTSSALTPTILPDAQHIVSYHAITEGTCWCESPGHPALRLEAGDVLLVPHGHAYRLASACGLRSGWTLDETLEWFREMAAGRLPFVTEGGSGPERLRIICGFLGCDGQPFNPILAALPALLRVRLDADSDGRLKTLLAFALAESARAVPGSRSVLRRVAELVFVEVLRSHLTAAATTSVRWLTGLRDPLVGRALARLHAEPARGWTLQALAHEIGTSRSILAERFTSLVGHPPMLYLTQWRMQLASGHLARGATPVSAVAAAVGYESEAAFCRAFKKVTGVTPAAWRTQSRR